MMAVHVCLRRQAETSAWLGLVDEVETRSAKCEAIVHRLDSFGGDKMVEGPHSGTRNVGGRSLASPLSLNSTVICHAIISIWSS